MDIRRVLALAAAVAAFVTAPALLVAQDNDQIEQREARDVQALVQMVDGVADGTQPTPAGFGLEWDGNHFMKAAGGGAYIPFSITVDAAQLGAPDAAMYVRAVNKAAAEATAAEPGAEPEYAWDDVSVVNVGPDGKLSRAKLKALAQEIPWQKIEAEHHPDFVEATKSRPVGPPAGGCRGWR